MALENADKDVEGWVTRDWPLERRDSRTGPSCPCTRLSLTFKHLHHGDT